MELTCENKYTVLAQLFWYHVKGKNEENVKKNGKTPEVKWSVIAPAFNVPEHINLSQKASNSCTYSKCREYLAVEKLLEQGGR